MAIKQRGSIWSIVRVVRDARRGDVRAKEELYQLRGVMNFVGVFALTVLVPGLLLAWYGFEGIRAEQRAGNAEVVREAEQAAAEASKEVERYFEGFEDATLNRLKSGESLGTSLGELADTLRVVFRFDVEGELAGPFSRADVSPLEDQTLLPVLPLSDGLKALSKGDANTALSAYSQATREAHGERAEAVATLGHAHALLLRGDTTQAEAAYTEVFQRFGDIRDAYGFRMGDIARLKIGELRLAYDPIEGQDLLQGLVDELLISVWPIGRGGEAAVARRALDLLATRSDPDWLARTRIHLGERSAQHYQAGRLLAELDSLGSRGRLLKVAPGDFSYQRTEQALWAITWTDADQYVLALDLRGVLGRIRILSDRATRPDSDVRVEVLGPDSIPSEEAITRRSLSPWLPGWALVVRPRDPASLRLRQQEQWRRGVGIVGLSVLMIGVGAVLSGRLLQRELDAAREKSDFAARVSHELRSPITQIRLKAEALSLGLATSEDARQRHYAVIMRESERLSRLVDNMLDFAAIERGLKKYSMRPGDMCATVSRAVETAAVGMEMQGIEVEVELPDDLPPVWHDADAICQAITNLLSNAAKYGKDEAWVGVRVRTVDNEVWVEISDRGIGIAPEEQAKIFDQYYRSPDPLARRRKGTGLGLTIVKYIVEAHGGRATVRSAPGKGSTFILQFHTKNPELPKER